MTTISATRGEKEKFADHILANLLNSPFGAVNKGEYDLAIFSALIEAGIIDEDTPVFSLAQQLRCAPARINSLLFSYRLRKPAPDPSALAQAVRVVGVRKDAKDQEMITLNVENRFWRESLIANLKVADVYTDTSFNRERLTLPVSDFVDTFTQVFGSGAGDLKAALDAAVAKSIKQSRFEVLKDVLKKAAGSGAAKGAAIVVGTLATHIASH